MKAPSWRGFSSVRAQIGHFASFPGGMAPIQEINLEGVTLKDPEAVRFDTVVPTAALSWRRHRGMHRKGKGFRPGDRGLKDPVRGFDHSRAEAAHELSRAGQDTRESSGDR